MESKNNNLLLGFYGDDLTGSTDALEFLSYAGAKAMLFFTPPSQKQLNKYPSLDAVGIAGMTRSMPPKAIEKTLQSAFESLKTIHPKHIHYKVCSTFDSSPTVGSIGKAIDVATKIFNNPFIPLLVAAPHLGRYCTFGNLFARMGIGSQGEIYRLDRHPSMQNHPSTPANESDLRLHLGKQTKKSIGLLNILDIEQDFEENIEQLNKLQQKGSEIILMDALYEYQMERIGHLLDYLATNNSPLFSVGSSGIEKALTDYWLKKRKLTGCTHWEKLEKKEPVLVLSGSCSPITSNQIEWATAHNFYEISINPKILTTKSRTLKETYTNKIVTLLKEGKNVILHTCRGPKDSRLRETNSMIKSGELEDSDIAFSFGNALGQVAKSALEQISIDRLVIAGGDTSGHVARVLGIESIEMIAPLVKGAPICKAHAPNSPVDGIEINFKGGQVGDKNYFEIISQGQIK